MYAPPSSCFARSETPHCPCIHCSKLCAWVQNDMGTPMRRFMRSTASSGVDSPKAPWSANSGGVRHGAARSISASRRKSGAPARARPQVRFQGSYVCCP